ncbi:Cytochrome C553 (soluble cytochrome f) [Helicobacter heilmannii]|nr:c-type cytochrome [Helicobacter heilmannii]BDQ26471.1 cytochrome c-553 [Helicobacter heilmannii]CCM11451.2 Cytochrome C553 (soluble cytochrome f) [Helicobacter heilmannii ASB1.4]CRF47599.1 Cytochrome C553 (soluble cytochrome f) [Helicobacter heilmannii]CRF50997.1 Cytochrome C553 (soluble cytochrome f) [Helicobacter heilmannii]
MKKVLFLGVVLCLGLLGAAEPAELIKKCAGCHGPTMNHKAFGKGHIVNTLDSATIKEDLMGYKAGTLNRYGAGKIMHMQVKALSDTEIEALAKYIPTLKK